MLSHSKVALEHHIAQWVTQTYAFKNSVNCELLDRPTLEKLIVRITVGKDYYWLRLYLGKPTSIEQLEEEASLVNELYAQGMQVAPPLRRQDGQFAGVLEITGNQLPGVLYANAIGVQETHLTVTQAEALGRLLAELHNHATTLRIKSRPTINYHFLAEEPLNYLAPWLGEKARSRVLAIAQEMRTIIWGNASALAVGFCHGDVHLENIKFQGTVPTLFDFESCGLSLCVYDLACYWRNRISTSSDQALRSQEWAAILQGYHTVRRLSAQELAAIPALATLRAIWVMALPAQPGATWGNDWLNDPDYIQAHLEGVEALAKVLST
ncbi:phosphotransferase [Cyanobacteria bacterium FACHB-DQ100]|nr:phosphotransferase [Cyanobacteria bacterium FACHB-DQ100]